MKRISLSLFLCASLVFVGCKNEKKEKEEKSVEETEMNADMQEQEEQEMAKTAQATLQAKNDSKLSGTVTFTEEDGEVSMEAKISGLPEGKHAIHIHEKGDCSSADGKSAGGHWNPTGEDHGKWGAEEGYHKGDIGNFETDAEGNATVSMSTDEWCIGCDDENKNIVGKSIIVHDGVDDFTSQPSGAAGTRVGCGVIEKQ
ncbi:superoxide dismutase family protein [Salegentibacter chungangensis]|uniref:Superoxide dismutase family protein n=1 Tax=Salegentibacter chungangensis TaxID=1335724 RepID=A0ABW3NPE6_9FLAO